LSDVNFDAIANNSISGNKIYGGLLSADTANIGNNAFVVTNDGNVGVGTTSPSYELQIVGSAQAANFWIQPTAGTIGMADNSASVVFYDATGAFGETKTIKFFTDSLPSMSINSSGNVGIGTSSPSGNLTVIGSLNNGQIVASQTSSNSADKYGAYTTLHYNTAEENFNLISGSSGTTNNQIFIGGGLGEYNAATIISFYTASNNTTTVGTERMRIDSSGRVTMPYQPSFAAYKTNSNNYSAYTPLDWTTTHNIGNHFNGQRFTAPISGLYHFEYGGITHSVSNYFYLGFSLNGSYTVQPAKGSWRHLPQTESEYHHMHTSLTLYLNAGDYIDARTGFNGGTPYLEGDRSSFSGYLVG